MGGRLGSSSGCVCSVLGVEEVPGVSAGTVAGWSKMATTPESEPRVDPQAAVDAEVSGTG